MDAHAFPALVLFLFCFLLFIVAFCLMRNINPFLFQKAVLVYTENPLHFNVNHNGTLNLLQRVTAAEVQC